MHKIMTVPKDKDLAIFKGRAPYFPLIITPPGY
jgi:hypothetical protein